MQMIHKRHIHLSFSKDETERICPGGGRDFYEGDIELHVGEILVEKGLIKHAADFDIDENSWYWNSQENLEVSGSALFTEEL